MTATTGGRLSWTTVAPALAIVVLVVTWGRDLPYVVSGLVALVLVAAVLSAVHHAEVVAHRVGEPFGSLVLAVAVTVIEVGLIVTLMVSSDGKDTSTLARDTVFAAVMITTNGIVGLTLAIAALRHHLAEFNAEGAGSAVGTVLTLATLCLVLPTFTTTNPGPRFSGAQLTFAAIASLVLYAMFVFTQTVRHRDFFLPVKAEDDADGDGHADLPSNRQTYTSLALLVVALVAVVGLAKTESPAIEAGVAGLGFPASFVGVVIALLVLAPESIAAVRAAMNDKVQVSLNLAYGSAIASIGLTIPAIAIASIWLDGPLTLGLGQNDIVLLAITAVVSVLTVVPGRSKPLQGGVHLVLAAAWLFLSIQP